MMKSFIVLGAILALVRASPTPTIEHEAAPALQKRASISEAANLGYATLNGGTKGGAGGTVTTVSTLAQFTAAVNEKDTAPRIVVVQGTISGSAKVRIGSNKSVIGLPGATFSGIALYIRRQSNVIIRNIKSQNVLASTGDGLGIDHSTNVWVDHCEFSSSLSVDKDYYDGLIDVTHAADFVTLSYVYFHDHWKSSLVGHSDSNGSEDKGHLRVTYANCYWKNCNSRGPSVRFGTAHIYNNYYESMPDAINTRMGAQVLVQSNAFKGVKTALYSKDSDNVGYAVAIDNDFGGAANTAPSGTMNANSPGYSYTLLGSSKVAATVPGQAGARLTF